MVTLKHSSTSFILATLIFLTCIMGYVYASDQVPDNQVWTPPSATFFYGQSNANISCKFLGIPYGVYWMKGSTASTADTLVSRIGGKVSGPKFNDGSLNITEDYSLVFNDIQAADAGNYICRVSNYNGFLITNNTDVRVLDPDQVSIFTEPSITGWADASVSLQCTFIGNPKRVLWNRAQRDPETKSVETVLRYTSDGYEVLGDRRYSWSASYGLIIRDLMVLDGGNFTCMVSKTGGTEIQNTTVLTVHARAQKPYIQIPQCKSQPAMVTNGTILKPCLYNVTEDQDSFELQCSVIRAKPQVDILWQEGSRNLTAETIVSQRPDDAFDVTATITRRTNQTTFTFTCIASGLAVNGTTERTVTVLITKFAKDAGSSSRGPNSVAIAFVILVLVLAMAFLIFIMIRVRKYHKFSISSGNPMENYESVDPEGNSCTSTSSCFKTIITKDCLRWIFFLKKSDGFKTEAEQPLNEKVPTELERLREELKDYKPGKATDNLGGALSVETINIGLFGVMGVGKSSFINSMNYAFSGEYNNVAVEAENAQGGSRTKLRETVNLTKHIHIMDNRGMKDYSKKQVKDSLLPQIRGERGVDSKDKIKEGKVVHCPVFVCNFSQPVPRDKTLKFLAEFSSKVDDYYGRHVMVVVTHKKETADTIESHKDAVKSHADVPKDYIWAFENYTEKEHEHDEARSVEYLKFLKKCLDIAERNIMLRSEKSKQRRASFFGSFKKK